jgi:hypothetical protein
MCVKPIRARRNEFGRPTLDSEGDLLLPCGKCHECITLNAADWGLRTQHELGDHDDNCCLTLTYDDGHLPSLSERKREFQLFMKKLRRSTGKKLLYLVSHEFGSSNGRLHHHAILFGHSFYDQKFHKTTAKGTDLFTSRTLDKLWSNGWCNIGEASVKAGHYIASYALKKQSQSYIDNDSGEIIDIDDCMDCSKNPGIGLNYLRRNHRQMVLRGDRMPRYYRKKMTEIEKFTLDDYSRVIEKKGIGEVNLMLDMYESAFIYDGMVDFEQRDQRQILDKFKIFRQKLKNDGEYRKKVFTKQENYFYNYFKADYSRNLTLEDL